MSQANPLRISEHPIELVLVVVECFVEVRSIVCTIIQTAVP